MKYEDTFSSQYKEILEGGYKCIDRVVVKGYHGSGHHGGGFRNWWRCLYGTDENLDNAHLMRMAGHFSRSVKAFCERNKIPIEYYLSKERKHEQAEVCIPERKDFCGIFLVQVSRRTACVWDVKEYENGQIHLQWKKPWPFVNHYSFHIIDPEWGHITINMSSHPPFDALIILNGHEWVERKLQKEGIEYKKEGNSFTAITNGAALDRVADTLNSENSIGRLSEVCDRWLYSACLCFGITTEEQERTGFRYDYYAFQLEYSENLLFNSGTEMEAVFQSLIDRTRRILDIQKVSTIMGAKKRPSNKRLKVGRFKVSIEKPSYDLTVFKIHYGYMTLKIYDKGGRLLRIEVTIHSMRSIRIKKAVCHLPIMVKMMKEILVRFLDTVQSVGVEFISDGFIDELAIPTLRGRVRLPGINLRQRRMQDFLAGLFSLALQPSGFTISELAMKVREKSGRAVGNYSIRNLSYDLKKLRGKKLVEKIGRSRRYRLNLGNAQQLLAYFILEQKVITPVTASIKQPRDIPDAKTDDKLENHYHNLRKEIYDIFKTLAWSA